MNEVLIKLEPTTVTNLRTGEDFEATNVLVLQPGTTVEWEKLVEAVESMRN